MKIEVNVAPEGTYLVDIVPENYDEALLLCHSQGMKDDEWFWENGQIRLRAPVQKVNINVCIDESEE